MQPESRRDLIRPAIVYALLFGGAGAYIPYISLYLGSRGLDLGTVGALIALFSAVSLFAAPTWAAVADGIGDARGPILVAVLLSAAAAALLAVVVTPALLAVAIASLAASFGGVVPMVDSRVVRVLGGRERFGQARASGSASFIVVAFAAGAVIQRSGPPSTFALFVPLLVATGVAAWVLLGTTPIGEGGRRRRPSFGGAARMALGGLSPTTIATLLALPRYGLFFFASVVIWTSQAAYQGFISLRITDLGGDATTVAAAWSVGPVIEVALMLSFPALARRFGAGRLIVIGGLGFALRSAIASIASGPGDVVVASAFGGVGFAFAYVGTVTWIAGAVSRSMAATAQGMITGTAVSIGAILGSILGGVIGGAWGLGPLIGVTAVGYALGGILVWRSIGGRDEPVAGGPTGRGRTTPA